MQVDSPGARREERPRSRQLRLPRRAVGLAVALGALVVGLAPTATAAGPASFYAVASADGVRYGTAARGFLVVEEFVDVGAPAAQSVASSTDSTAYAALPFPGSTVFAGLDLGAGAGDQYPAAAISDSARPDVDKSSGPVVLTAKSGPDKAEAVARSTVSGSPTSIGRVEARATSLHDKKGTATAKAETHLESFSLGVLRLGAVDSVAQVVATDAGKRTRTSSLEVGGVTVVGQAVGLTEKGLVVAGTTTPLPPDAGLGRALRDQDITVEYVKAEQTPDGVISAGVRVTQLRDVPTLPEPVEVSYLFGRATVGASGGASEATLDGVDPPADAAPAADPGTEDSSAAPADDAAPAADVPAGDSGSAETPIDAGAPSDVGTPQDTGAAAAPPETADAAPPGDVVQAGAAREALTLDPALFYLVLVLGGVLLLGGASSVRLFGVKVMWS
ncbi:MAG: hypothetical protein JWO60_2549 [Frankiales bacterium]|nr:hypothetical protein [Frankiales bacterium]